MPNKYLFTMRYLFIFIFLGSVQPILHAHTNECYDGSLKRGLIALNEKDFDKAIKTWQVALDNCEPDRDQRNTLNNYIEKARLRLNTTTPVTLYVSEPEMVFVKGGSFQMGSNSGLEDEKPVHSVTLSSYYIGKYEITQKQWRDVMGSDLPLLVFKGCDDCPVEKLNYEEVQTFLAQLNAATGKNYRLPTEAEWEFAERGGNASKNFTYSGSNEISEVAWYKDNSESKTHPVGKRKVNELGIYDMTGNVWEWCSDWYDANYYSTSPTQNPICSVIGSNHVARGGSWINTPVDCRITHRHGYTPSHRVSNLGFRVALSSQ